MAARFFYYLILINMIANIMVFTPEVLIKERFSGSVQALIWAFLIGTFFILMFNYLMKNFYGQSIVELMKKAFPVWLQKVILVYLFCVWFFTGILSISVFTYIVLTFMNPDSSTLLLIALLGGFVCFAALLRSDKILYFLEAVLALSVPFLAFILFKSLVNPYFSWNSVMQISTYINRLPSYTTISAATYIYSGYANMVIFSQCFSKKQSFKYIWMMGILGFLISIHTFFVPIGFHGTVAVGMYQYPWVITSDSIRMTYGIIERLLYPFLLLYSIVSLINSVIHLHISFQFIKGIAPASLFKGKWLWLWPSLFLAAIFLFNHLTTEPDRYQLSILWLIVRLPSEALLLIILLSIRRRLRHVKKT